MPGDRSRVWGQLDCRLCTHPWPTSIVSGPMNAAAAARTSSSVITAFERSSGEMPEKRVLQSLARSDAPARPTYRTADFCRTCSSRTTLPQSSTNVALARADPSVVSIKVSAFCRHHITHRSSRNPNQGHPDTAPISYQPANLWRI